MILDLSNVLSEQHSTIEESVPIEMTSFRSEAGTFPIIWKSPLALCIEYAGDQELKIAGKGEVRVTIPCDRCLTDVETLISLSILKERYA